MTSSLAPAELELRRMTDREISQMIELWREEACLWKVTSKNYADVDAVTHTNMLLQMANC